MLILLVYGLIVCISAIALIWLNNADKKTYFIKLILHICVPIVAWFFPLMWSKNSKKEEQVKFQAYLDRQFIDMNRYKQINYQAPEKEKDLNIVPLDEALLVSKHTDRRQMLIEVLKRDATNYIDVLQRAIVNPDSETSHYAVSAIMEVKRKLLNSIQELEVKYAKNPEQSEIGLAYSEVLLLYTKSGFIDERSKKKYQYTYLTVLSRLIKQVADNEVLYRAKIDMDLELGQMTEAELTAQEYILNYPLNEQAYVYNLKVYYSLRSENRLYDVLSQLKVSPIKLSSEGLKIVRFWSKKVVVEHENQIEIPK